MRVIKNKIVLLRAGFDVPVRDGTVLDDKRIKEGLPTIKELLKQDNKVVILTHLGRPDGKRVKSLSSLPVANALAKLLKRNVTHLDECVGLRLVIEQSSNKIFVLENVRFHKEEEANDSAFAKALAKQGDVFVMDAFSNSHRNHASMVGIPKYLPSTIGMLVKKEVAMLKTLDKPKRPYVVVLGGAKLDKLPVIQSLMKKADCILLGGALAVSFYKSLGVEIGKSKAEQFSAKKMLVSEKILLPVDFRGLVRGKVKTFSFDAIPKNAAILDNGPNSDRIFSEIIKQAQTVVWNGPMGMYEDTRFSKSSVVIARAMQKNKGMRLAGGGDTLAFLGEHRIKLPTCSGGGAMLAVLEGKKLPALQAIKQL